MTETSAAHYAEDCMGGDWPGDDVHPLYAQLTSMPEPIGGDVQWNFQKYLVSRDGEVAAKFNPTVTPDDPDLVTKIEELLP